MPSYKLGFSDINPEGMAGSYGSSIFHFFFKEPHAVLHIKASPIYISTKSAGKIPFPHLLHLFFYSLSDVDHSHDGR